MAEESATIEESLNNIFLYNLKRREQSYKEEESELLDSKLGLKKQIEQIDSLMSESSKKSVDEATREKQASQCSIAKSKIKDSIKIIDKKMQKLESKKNDDKSRCREGISKVQSVCSIYDSINEMSKAYKEENEFIKGYQEESKKADEEESKEVTKILSKKKNSVSISIQNSVLDKEQCEETRFFTKEEYSHMKALKTVTQEQILSISKDFEDIKSMQKKIDKMEEDCKKSLTKSKKEDTTKRDGTVSEKTLDFEKKLLMIQEEADKLEKKAEAKMDKFSKQLEDKVKENRDKSITRAEAFYPKSIDKYSQSLRGVDLCFIMDATYSMQKWINETKDRLQKVIDTVEDRFKGISLRVAVICYRDHCDTQQFELKDFTTNIPEVKSFISNIEAIGGGDGPEDVNGGYQKALSDIQWKSTTKLIIHVADAPCHNQKYSEYNGGDDYPNGHPDDLTFESIFEAMKKMGIDYTFLKIDKYTDSMIKNFKQIWDGTKSITKFKKRECIFNQSDLNGSLDNFFPTTVNSISASISRTFSYHSTSMTVDSKMPKYSKSKKVDKSFLDDELFKKISFSVEKSSHPKPFPRPSEFKYEQFVTIYAIDETKSMEKMLDADKLKFKYNTAKVQHKYSLQPFAEGAFNLAYHVIDDKETKLVMKINKEKQRLNYTKEMEKNSLSVLLAKQFNEELSKKGLDNCKLQMINTFFAQNDDGNYYMFEGYMPGDYVKYTNNYDYENEDLDTRRFTAYSHFTYQNTKGQFMVTDLQGVGSLLTDPAIHSATKIFKEVGGDLGIPGMTQFFKNHKCNGICKKLNLEPHPSQESGNFLLKSAIKEKSGDIKDIKGQPQKCKNKLCNNQVKKQSKAMGDPESEWCKECLPKFVKGQDNLKKKPCADNCKKKEFKYNTFYVYSQIEQDLQNCPSCRLL